MPNRPKVVVIDDDVLTLKILTSVLNGQGFQVRVASDSITGLNLVENEHPDLIVLDIDMPEKNGFQLLTELRHNSATEQIPILMLTAEMKTQSVGLAIDLGANAYFKKPFNHVELSEKMRELIGARSRRPSSGF